MVLCKRVFYTDIIAMAPGTYYTMLVRRDGSVWSSGTIADCPDARSKSFVKVIPSGATAAAVGNYFSIVLNEDGYVWLTEERSRGAFFFFDGSTTSSIHTLTRVEWSKTATIRGQTPGMTIASFVLEQVRRPSIMLTKHCCCARKHAQHMHSL